MAEFRPLMASPQEAKHAATGRRRLGVIDLLLVLMSVIWGINFTVIKTALVDFSPLSFTAMRFLIASLVLLAVTRLLGRRPSIRRGDLGPLMFLGVVGHLVYQVAFIEGLARTRAGNAALILATTPVFIALLSAAIGHDRLNGKAILGVSLSFVGMTIIVTSNGQNVGIGGTLFGNLLLFGSTVCWAFYTVGLKRFIVRYGPLATMRVAILSGTGPLWLVSIPSLRQQSWSSIRPEAWAGLLFSALGAIVVSFFIWNYAIKRIGSTRTAAFSNLTPIFALVVAWLVLHERPSVGQLIGAAVILLGIYLTRGETSAGKAA
ncbi:MAG: EamA family transporter [Acidobacteria bacterium]|nr:EamA family transporter [Acidobacteriota bacterium]MBI3657286.1 EamA family transporter [Acidobacteriota bacterium]